MLIIHSSFSIVTFFAQRLPVLLVPEQHLISPVRFNMINNSCRCQFPIPFTLRAKWMVCQKPFTRLLPPTAIATIKGAGSIFNMHFDMKFAIMTACQLWATWMLAWSLRFCRHEHEPPLHKEKPSKLAAPRTYLFLLFSHDIIIHPKNTPKRTLSDIYTNSTSIIEWSDVLSILFSCK